MGLSRFHFSTNSLTRTVVIFGGVVIAALLGALPHVTYADIRDTKHNLSGKALDQKARSAMTREEDRRWLNREVCVFCHTPSVADEIALRGAHEAPSAPPGWQKSLDPEFAYDIFDDTGRLGGEGEEPIGSVSVACLSCHDSTQAFGVTSSADNHPFGVPYRGVEQTATKSVLPSPVTNTPEAPARAAKFIAEDSQFRPVRSGVVNRRKIWWASNFDSGQRTKNDLPLYPRRTSTGGESAIPFVECTSCHDPHTTATVFLRIVNNESRLCGTCHVK
jgi:predicted CXXCH cytochrome family protein